MDKVRLGLIGCGDIAFRSYLPAIKQIPERVELAAVCDSSAERVEQAKSEYGAREGYRDAEQMLAKAELDGVMVLTSMVPHGPLCIAALEAGKHVYVEKVMAVEIEQADRMVELAEGRNLILSCAPSTILLSAFQRAKEIVGSGEIGRVTFAHAIGAHHGPARWDGYTSDPTWFYRPGGGPLFDLAVYPVQILTHLLGPVKQVSAFAGVAVPEVTLTPGPVREQTLHVQTEDTIVMLLDFGNATFATVDASYNMLNSRFPNMQIFGTQGSLTTPQFLGDEIGLWHRGDKEWQVTHLPKSLYDQLGVAAGMPHWLDCIAAGRQPVNNGRHARHVLDIFLSCHESARTGRAVEVTRTF